MKEEQAVDYDDIFVPELAEFVAVCVAKRNCHATNRRFSARAYVVIIDIAAGSSLVTPRFDEVCHIIRYLYMQPAATRRRGCGTAKIT